MTKQPNKQSVRVKHNKMRNTGVLFELLARQITSDILSGKNSPAVDILKEYFTNSELAKEYKLYNMLISSNVINEAKASILIEAAIDQYKKLNKTSLRKQRYNVIKEIKKHYNLENFFKAKIDKYKVYASSCLLFESAEIFVNPDIIVKNKVSLLEHLTKQVANDESKDKLMAEYLESDKGTRFLTYKILIEKFNKKYSGLDDFQKEILREYINNISNTNLLKEYINEKFAILKKQLKNEIKNIEDKTVAIKLNEVISIIKPIGKNENVKDDDVLNLLQYSELAKELNETV